MRNLTLCDGVQCALFRFLIAASGGVGGGQPATVVVLSNGSILMGSGPACGTANGDSVDGTIVTSTANGGIGGKQSLDIGESFDSGSELLQQQQQQLHASTTINNSSNGGNTIKTTVLDMKNHGSIQVSQV